MDRRTFVLLTGAASTALWRPTSLVHGVPRLARAAGGLRFDLDEQRRWSLWYHGGRRPVPLVRDATLGVWVGDALVTLADLEDISVANRRPPGGESLAIRGRAAAGVWIEAEFAAWEAGPGAQGSISASIYPDRVLATIRGVRFFSIPEGQVLPDPAAGRLLALINGYESRSPCRVAGAGADAVSHAALGLTRDTRALAFGFEPAEPGEGQVRVSGGGLDTFSDWLPGRPVRPEGDTSTLRIAYLPEGDGLAALHALATPASEVDRERLATLAPPAGWRAAPGPLGPVTEEQMLANLEFCAGRLDRRALRFIQLGDGYQRSAGDWDTNARFPNGHRWLTHRIHERGFLAGLWLAPFAVAEQSGLPAQHPDWLAKGLDGGPLVMETRPDRGGTTYVLDGAHPEVRDWLRALARRVVRDWGYDYVELDLLAWATHASAHYGGLTRSEAYRHGLTALREGLGTETLVVGNGAPLQHSAGLVTGMRIGPGVDATWGSIEGAARAAALRSFYHRAAWLNDAGGAVARPPLTLDEARVWASVVALAGGANMLSDPLPELPADRLTVLQRTVPVSPVAGRPLGSQVEDRDVAPAIVAGDDVVPMGGPWRFRTGDDSRYAEPGYDDENWETIPLAVPWEDAGHPGYDGVAWYRTRFTLPVHPERTGDEPVAVLELGKVDDADETFLNGVRVGATAGALTYRRYTVPASALRWGGENVVAIRVTDGGGPGGLWRLRRERPAAVWVAEGAPRWWTVALVNWDDEPQAVSQPVGVLGAFARLAAYDVWGERPFADVQEALSATLAPRTTLTVALRPAAPHPQIIGTTRHVIQGAIDVTAEVWDPASRALSATSVNLDGRPYAVTVAVPRGLRAGACQAGAPCTVRRLETGHAVIEWPAGTTQDVSWSLGFVAAGAPNRGRPED